MTDFRTDFRADLHMHTHCSDGTDSPLDLLQKAKKASLQGLSITDHDTIEAYTPEFFSLAEQLDIKILPGVELSSELEEISVHILGYGIDLQSNPFHLFLEQMIERRSERNRAILAKLKQRGLVIEEKELVLFAEKECRHRTIGRPHIAELMFRKGYVAKRQDAFERYLKEGALCYACGIRYTPKEVIEEIHKAGGKAILAHPHFISQGPFLDQLLKLPFDGIECYYGNFSHDQHQTWLNIASQKNWIVTGGSDYHGALKPHISLGSSWVDFETFKKLQSKSS